MACRLSGLLSVFWALLEKEFAWERIGVCFDAALWDGRGKAGA